MSRRPGRSAIGTWRWTHRIRPAILLRDGGRCRYCGGVATTVDHVVRREHGGDDTEANLVACCKDCQYPSRRPAFLDQGQSTETSAVSLSLPRDTSHAILSGDYGKTRR